MRLLQIDENGELSLTGNLYKQVPRYAILSHTWYPNDDDEVTLKDMMKQRAKDKKGFRKIQFCADQARRSKLDHCWVDTCCIDKKNSVELDESIRSMYRWYAESSACYVYLADVPTSQGLAADKAAISMSRWFLRGWTLQELLAPATVHFFAEDGSFLGDKEALQRQIYVATGIPSLALTGAPLSTFPITERLAWAARRETKRPEDLAYCLQGIFGVFMSMMYGEGEEHAFRRLQKAILEKAKERPGPTALETALQRELQRQDTEMLQVLERSESEIQLVSRYQRTYKLPSNATQEDPGSEDDRGRNASLSEVQGETQWPESGREGNRHGDRGDDTKMPIHSDFLAEPTPIPHFGRHHHLSTEQEDEDQDDDLEELATLAALKEAELSTEPQDHHSAVPEPKPHTLPPQSRKGTAAVDLDSRSFSTELELDHRSVRSGLHSMETDVVNLSGKTRPSRTGISADTDSNNRKVESTQTSKWDSGTAKAQGNIGGSPALPHIIPPQRTESEDSQQSRSGLRTITKGLLGLRKTHNPRPVREITSALKSMPRSHASSSRREAHRGLSSRSTGTPGQSVGGESFSDAFQRHVRQPAILEYMREVGREVERVDTGLLKSPIDEEGTTTTTTPRNAVGHTSGEDQMLKDRMEDDDYYQSSSEFVPPSIRF